LLNSREKRNDGQRAGERRCGTEWEVTKLGIRSTVVQERRYSMAKLFLWFILLVLCWPLALAALILYPLVWLLLLPFRLAGVAVKGALGLIEAIILLPTSIFRRL
jgi:hypothetical protein